MWQCKKCKFQKKDEQGFKLLGNDFVQCPRCGQVHYVPCGSGELVLIQERRKYKVMAAKLERRDERCISKIKQVPNPKIS